MNWQAIKSFRLVTAELDRLTAFYEALGFVAGAPLEIAVEEIGTLGLTGAGRRVPLTLGASRIDLDAFEKPGRSYPDGTNAADLVFQHLALVTDDARADWARAAAAGAFAISRDGPVELPMSSGGVTAIKFRDPEGHPLEFLQFPAGSNPAWKGRGTMGIDHSAISVADVAASRRFYAEYGLTECKGSINHGPAQVALDGLNDVCVDVVPMNPPIATPHVELLGYRAPSRRALWPLAANDVAATRIVWRAETDELMPDPDGHFHQLTRQDR